MKIYKFIAAVFMFLLFTLSCSKSYLDIKPFGTISASILSNKAGVDGVLIGAYSLLDGGGAVGGVSYLGSLSFLTGNDEHNSGTEWGALPQNAFIIDPSMGFLNDKWMFLYAGVNRCNDVLKLLPSVKDAKTDDLIQFEAEAKFLRGVYYMYLAMLWKNVPWIDETIDYSAKNYFVSNTMDIYPKIEADFEFAADNLTATKSQVGRANKWAAKCFLVKAYMFQKKFSEAKTLLDDIIPNGVTSNGKKYGLQANYGDNFKVKTKHSEECVFAVQMSVNDGANGANGNFQDYFNGTYGSAATCCYGMTQPAFDFVDSFQTDSITGLPMPDTYYLTPIPTDQGLTSNDSFTPYTGTLDSRLDWSVGRRGIPYLDWGVHPGKAWIRNQFVSGPYSAVKNIAIQANVNIEREVGFATSNPYNMIRFSDVLLWAAECEVEVGSLAKAEEYVNIVRARAANPAGWVHTYIDNANPLAGFTDIPAANYKVGLYTGQFTVNGKSYARKAVRFERKIELAMEWHRFFDIRRYDGNDFDQAVLHNNFMKREAVSPITPNNSYKQGVFVKGKHELYPIPQAQIDLMILDGVSVLVQNPGY